MVKKRRPRKRQPRPTSQRSREGSVDPLLLRVDELADHVAHQLRAILPLLSSVRAVRSPFPRDRADVDISATRVGRMLQLLQGARILARYHLGTALASVARAMWETWFDSAWLLHDSEKRTERATAFWTAGIAQQLGIIRVFEERDGYLEPRLQEAKAELEALVRAEPHLYSRWLTDQAQPKCSVHRVRWIESKANGRERAKSMGPMYERSYDLDYTLLSVSAHGEGLELPRLINDNGDDATVIEVGEGKDAAVSHLLLGTGAALTLVYEIQRAYLGGGHAHILDDLRAQAETLRRSCPTIL